MSSVNYCGITNNIRILVRNNSDKEQYYKERREVLDNNNLSNRLIVLTSVNNFKEILELELK